jgi:hypothetical protein
VVWRVDGSGRRSRAALLVGGGIGLSAVLLTSAPAGAAVTITVTSNADAGAGTLRQAFIDASGNPADDTSDVVIDIPASVSMITLTTGQLAYNGGNGGTHTLTLNGSGNTIDQTTANSRVIDDTAGTLFTISGLTVTGGHPAAAQDGGGILVNGSATVTNTVITGNTATAASVGGLRVSNGNLVMTDSSVTDNHADAFDGGIFVAGTATVTGSTISQNSAGGGIAGGIETGALTHANATFINSTISDNTGGGITPDSPLTLVYATVVMNTGSVGNVDFHNFPSGVLTSFASVVALPDSGVANCQSQASTTSHGFNFSDDASCGFTAATDKQSAGDPKLGPLANNGGATQTRLPQPGSPLIDAIPVASCQADGASGITTDQRGVSRPQGPGCDIGAVEVQVAAPAPAPAPAPVVITPKFTG